MFEEKVYSRACSNTGRGQTFMGLQNQEQDQRKDIHRMRHTTQSGQSGAVRAVRSSQGSQGSQGQSGQSGAVRGSQGSLWLTLASHLF